MSDEVRVAVTVKRVQQEPNFQFPPRTRVNRYGVVVNFTSVSGEVVSYEDREVFQENRTKVGGAVKAAIIQGGLIVDYECTGVDLASIEAKLTVHYYELAKQRAEKGSLDMYRLIASEMYGVSYGRVTPGMRQQAKLCAFRRLYSGKAFPG